MRIDAQRRRLATAGTHPDPRAVAEVFVMPLTARRRLVIAGAGHVGAALCGLGAMLDFDVRVVDDRPALLETDRLAGATPLVATDMAATLATLDWSAPDAVVIVTRGHRHDAAALAAVAAKPVGYVGMIGSRRKVTLIFDDCRAAGVPDAALQRVYSPVGLDIGSRTVAEIAVAIAAQLVAFRSGQFAPEDLRYKMTNAVR